jgi:hypothetical protein
MNGIFRSWNMVHCWRFVSSNILALLLKRYDWWQVYITLQYCNLRCHSQIEETDGMWVFKKVVHIDLPMRVHFAVEPTLLLEKDIAGLRAHTWNQNRASLIQQD